MPERLTARERGERALHLAYQQGRLSAESSWVDKCEVVIQDVYREERMAGSDYEQISRAIRDAYPFGVRANHPYDVWRREVNRTLEVLRPGSGKRCLSCDMLDGQAILELAGGGFHRLSNDQFAMGAYWGSDVMKLAVQPNGRCQRCNERLAAREQIDPERKELIERGQAVMEGFE